MKIFRIILSVLCTSALVFSAQAQYAIEVLDSNTFSLGEGVVLSKISFRGLSVVDDQTIWVSGSRGTIARSVDGGKTFVYSQLKGYEKSDFRDIEAFDAQRAIIMSSGTPALILKTIDGGQTWKEVFRQNDSAYFLDAMDFWDEKRGMLVGDPINNHFVLLQTKDGGETWQELDTSHTPKAMEGEAVFAASGTSLRCWGKDEFGFVTGGNQSRYIVFNQFCIGCKSGFYFTTGIQCGGPSKGAFSFCVSDTDYYDQIIVGGDYLLDTLTQNNISYFINKQYSGCIGLFGFYTADPEDKENDIVFPAWGYRSSVEFLPESRLIITCGITGVDWGRKTRFQITSESFHVVRKAKKGKAVFLAGPNGKIGKLIQ